MGGHASKAEAGTRGAVHSDVNVRALLDQIVEATNRLAAGLDAAGVNQPLRQSPAHTLRTLDRGLPNYTVEDLLLACEAYAIVTAPSALATGDLTQVRDEALHTLQLLRALAGSARGWRRLTGMTTVGVQGAFLRSAFNESTVRAALGALMEPLSALAFMDSTPQRTRRRLLPVGVGCFVPGTVLASALALIVFLLTSIAFATGQIALSPNGIAVSAFSDESHHKGGIAASAASASATPTARTSAPGPQPTATPHATSTATTTASPTATPTAGASPTATTPAGSPTLSASRSTVSPCVGTPDAFILTYSGGQSSVTWTATPSDPTDITLNPPNGTLQPSGAGSATNVTVTLVNDVSITGTITISTSNNLTRTVQFDSTGC
jgi:hypothetical protein